MSETKTGWQQFLWASITPRERLDEPAAELIPAEGRVAPAPPISLEILDCGYEGYLLGFDGAAKLSTFSGSAGSILLKLPSWEVVAVEGHFLEGVTVNVAKYTALIN